MTRNDLEPARTFALVKKVLVISFLIPLAFVWRFFVGDRFYPHTPLHPALGTLPEWLNIVCLTGMIGLLVAIYFLPNPRRAIGAFLILSFVFSLWDQSRWMPYFYQFFFMFFVLYGYSWAEPASGHLSKKTTEETAREANRVRNTLCMINLPIWLWSGLHKFSAVYVAVGYPWMIQPFLRFIPEDYHLLIKSTALLSPCIEAGGALLLLFPRTRLFGVLTLTAMHLVILILFGPIGLNWNPSVWSWNVAMIAFLWLLFHKNPAKSSELLFGAAKYLGEKIVHGTIVLLFLVMPFFNFFGFWDDFLSHCLYSWTTREAEIVVPAEAESRLPEEMRRMIRREHQPGILPVLDWSFSIFNSPPYHSYRVFFNIFGKVCETTAGDQSLSFRIFEKPAILTGRSERISYRCAAELGPRSIVETERRK